MESSSIHGLYYVSSASGPLARSVWFLCFCACAIAAAVVIFFNVAAWENSPAVVTSVSPALVKVFEKHDRRICVNLLCYSQGT